MQTDSLELPDDLDPNRQTTPLGLGDAEKPFSMDMIDDNALNRSGFFENKPKASKGRKRASNGKRRASRMASQLDILSVSNQEQAVVDQSGRITSAKQQPDEDLLQMLHLQATVIEGGLLS